MEDKVFFIFLGVAGVSTIIAIILNFVIAFRFSGLNAEGYQSTHHLTPMFLLPELIPELDKQQQVQ